MLSVLYFMLVPSRLLDVSLVMWRARFLQLLMHRISSSKTLSALSLHTDADDWNTEYDAHEGAALDPECVYFTTITDSIDMTGYSQGFVHTGESDCDDEDDDEDFADDTSLALVVGWSFPEALAHLDLSMCDLSLEDVQVLVRRWPLHLHWLSLAGSQLVTVPTPLPPTLRTLIVAFNQIDFAGHPEVWINVLLPTLRSINVTGCRLKASTMSLLKRAAEWAGVMPNGKPKLCVIDDEE
ncbi:hypothetical protein AMAG_10679 [Allomyces macrogynus ATCC 38327]|uniref:Uncharacterized protein n=1 Tax=Allomyces macrogynus (strain ATCC 38327) TaxID=578462 RepID=A0A0L0SR65_ALLM3|nr:hypothetical protein AMAG_10679 [Allomyces macrogynus ATCC 38327]|eukprot:KNE65013.1 hypothetical protein AMAG_10679 [Allomyces macrogynus ATCC 38327]